MMKEGISWILKKKSIHHKRRRKFTCNISYPTIGQEIALREQGGERTQSPEPWVTKNIRRLGRSDTM